MVIVAFKHMRKEEGGKCTRKRKIADNPAPNGHKQIFSTLSRDVVYFVPFDSFFFFTHGPYRSCFFLSSLSFSLSLSFYLLSMTCLELLLLMQHYYSFNNNNNPRFFLTLLHFRSRGSGDYSKELFRNPMRIYPPHYYHHNISLI